MNALDGIFQRSSGYIVAVMISEKAYLDSIIKEVVMRSQNLPKKALIHSNLVHSGPTNSTPS